MRPILLAFSFFFYSGVALAQGTPSSAEQSAVLLTPDQVTWSPAPPILPAGAKRAVLEGDPQKEGPFTIRASFPNGYRIAPHFHPAVERVTVLQGTFRLGMGDRFDAAALKSLPVSSFVTMQPGTHHFAQAKGNTVVQINGMGPWKLIYVNPADDPTGGKPTP